MILLAVTSDTWIVTGLGFGIVLALLFCLVFVLMLFGWIMQKVTAPKAPQAPKAEKPIEQPVAKPVVKAEPQPVVQAQAPSDDIPAIGMALYLAQRDSKHDVPTGMIHAQARETAWNTKSYGLNNVGF